MTRSAVVVRHLTFEDLGIAADVLTDADFDVRYLDAGVDVLDRGELVEADLLVVLGGPIGAGQTDLFPFLADEIDGLRARIASDRPTLGVCLGAQLIAIAMGATVAPSGGVEIGYAPLELLGVDEDDVLAPLDGVPVLHWHGDAFTVPDGAVRLAATPGCPNQAFSVGRTLALQFHLEADPARIEQWLIGHVHELTANEIDVARLRSDASTAGSALVRAGSATLRSWLARVEQTSEPV